MRPELDVKAFWAENKLCMKPFSTDKARVPITFWLDDHFIQREMAIESTVRYYTDLKYQLDIHRRCNARLEAVLGKKFYDEDEVRYFKSGDFEVLMGAERKIEQGNVPWIESKIEDIEDVKALIKKMERMDMRKAAIPEDWPELKRAFETETGKKLFLSWKWNRGPATLACNILGTVNLCFFLADEPEVMDDFFALLCDRFLEYRKAVLMEDYGFVPRLGTGIDDDCCYLFSPAHYERFCAPYAARIYNEFAPEPHLKRRHHSDSAMGHLMGIMNGLGINEVNFGPTIDPLEIRKAMPRAVIHGQLLPLLLLNGPREEIISAVRRDIELVGGDGGLVECTAGAVPIGTPHENILTYMWAVDTYGRY